MKIWYNYPERSFKKLIKKTFIANLLVLGLLLSGCVFNERASKNIPAVQSSVAAETEETELTTETPTQSETANTDIQSTPDTPDRRDLSERHPIDIAEEECMKKAESTVAMSTCSYDAMDKWYKEIDVNLIKLKNILSEEDYKNLEAAQAKWEAYKDAQNEAVVVIQSKQGTMFQNIYVGYQTYLIKERALFLQDLYNTLAN